MIQIRYQSSPSRKAILMAVRAQPVAGRILVSTRVRNQESAQLKVIDGDGNPVEVAAVVVVVVVWR
jgi:hypothetical protein